MILKLSELESLYYELNGITLQGNEPKILLQGILKQKMSLKLKVYLQRLNNVIGEDIKLYEEARKELFKKYGNEVDGTISIPNDKIADFNKDHGELLSTEKNIDTTNLWGTDFTIDKLENIETDEFYPVLFKLIEGT
jgi:hypothetical protein